MEINLFTLSLIVLGVIQIIMIVKFFEIANDISSIRRGFFDFIKRKENNIENASLDLNLETNTQDIKRKNENPDKFTWQSWIAIIVLSIALICLFIFCYK